MLSMRLKRSNVVHAKRSFTIQHQDPNQKADRYCDTVFPAMLGYPLKQNKDDKEGVRNGLKSIVPHAYGDHSSCGNCCGYLKNHASYKHGGFPYGMDLTGKGLRQSLGKIIEVSTMYMYGGTACSSPILNSHHFLVEEHTSKKIGLVLTIVF